MLHSFSMLLPSPYSYPGKHLIEQSILIISSVSIHFILDEEIVDLSIRQKFIDESYGFMREKYGLEDLDICDLEKEKMRVYNRWGKHIPSLLQEVRNQKLSKIL